MTSSRTFGSSIVALALAICSRAAAEPAGSAPGASNEPDAGTTTETVERCVADHERARLLKVERRWLEARTAAEQCAAQACPLSLRADCRDWMLELAELFASVIVIVETESRKAVKAKLVLDGKSIEIDGSGEPLLLPPGSYRLRFELPPYPPIERLIVLTEGEKNRVVSVRFARGPEHPRRLPSKDADRSAAGGGSPVAPVTYALAGGALLSGAASVALFFSALSQRDQALEDCAPKCGAGVRESIERKLLLSDLAAGGALTFAAAAVYTYVGRPRAPAFSPGSFPKVRVGFGESSLSVGVGATF